MAAAETLRAFDLPAAPAVKTLRQFADQSGVDVVFSTEATARVQTNAVRGSFEPAEAINLLLKGTGLIAERNVRTGAFTVLTAPTRPREPPKNPPAPRASDSKTSRLDPNNPNPSVKKKTPLTLFASLLAFGVTSADAQTASPAPGETRSENTVLLNPFMVRTDRDTGYQANSSVVATGFNRDVEHTPLMINILTEDMIRDAGLESYGDIAQFMPNTYVVPDPAGLGSAASARGQATSYYTQDGVRYYTEPIVRTGQRVEVIKGPATLFFGRAQPGGIFNFGTRPPSAVPSQSLTVTTGSFDKKMVDLGSQGKIDEAAKATYRVDAALQNNGSYLDNGYDRLKLIRAALSYQVFAALRVNLKYEYSHRDQSGSPITSTVISPQYYADYKNPRAQQIAWAKGFYGLGAQTDAAVADLLRGQWKENLANWIVMTRLTFLSDPKNPDGVYPTYATGVDAGLTPRGWRYNASAKGTYARKDVYNRGGDILWSPSPHFALKASYTKYDLKRPRLFISLSDFLADGTMRATPQVREDQNDSTTLSLSALFNYSFWRTHHTTNIGTQRFKDYYRNINGTFYALNTAPGVVKDPRPSTATVATAGYNPFTDPYPDIGLMVQRYPGQVTPPTWAENYEDATFASHIVELFDRKVGLLVGGRIQNYEVRNIPFKNKAGIDDINTMGISWEVKPNLVLFASRSKSFEPNINIFLVDGAGATQAEKNANIHPPVTGDGYDAGLKFGLLQRTLTGSISYFQTRRLNDAAFRASDLARTNADARNNDTDPNNNVTWYTPGGERLSKGVDLELLWQPNRQFSSVFTAGWLPFAKVTSNNAIPFVTTFDGRRIRDPNQGNYVGQRSPNAPKHTFSWWNHYNIPSTGFGLGLGANYVSEVEIPQISSYQVTVPSYTSVRVGADYTKSLTKTKSLRISLLLANALDRRYYISIYRAEPFSATLKVALQF